VQQYDNKNNGAGGIHIKILIASWGMVGGGKVTLVTEGDNILT